MPAKINIEEIKKRLLIKHEGVVSLDEKTYVNTHVRCKFIDKDHGEWWATPMDVIASGKGHRNRVIEKRKKTNMERYGISCILKNMELRKNGMMKKYGVDHPMHLESIKEKVKKTNIERYGVDNPTKNKDISAKVSKSMKKTLSEHPEIIMNSSLNSNISGKTMHWKTGETIKWTAGYERKVLEYLNNNKIDYNWQIPFILPDGRVYIIDAFLKEKNTYIEVKGYFRKDAREKWNWFHYNHPNSELWDEKKLKEMEIL